MDSKIKIKVETKTSLIQKREFSEPDADALKHSESTSYATCLVTVPKSYKQAGIKNLTISILMDINANGQE